MASSLFDYLWNKPIVGIGQFLTFVEEASLNIVYPVKTGRPVPGKMFIRLSMPFPALANEGAWKRINLGQASTGLPWVHSHPPAMCDSQASWASPDVCI